MSISMDDFAEPAKEGSPSAKNVRIAGEVLALFADPRLKGKIGVPAFNANTIDILLFNMTKPFNVMFGEGYPQFPPEIKTDQVFPESIIEQALQGWSAQTQLKDIIAAIMDSYQSFIRAQTIQTFSPGTDHLDGSRRKDSKQSSQEGGKRKVMMNGCADNQLTETKNLNRHFRSKLRQVYFEVVQNGVTPPQDARWIQGSFTLPRVGFEDIARVLKNQWFNAQINKQMENGKFMHKIMKGMMSIKSKKLMVKYYHVMLAAAKDPENFVKWKYQ